MKEYNKFIITLFALAILSPIGLYLPEFFDAKSAWGEWDAAEIQKMIGYTPQKMAEAAELWKAPMPDYALGGAENTPLVKKSAEYVLSALIGVLLCGGIGLLSAKVLARRNTP